MNFSTILEETGIHTSVPCRVDFGGTLDISTFYLSMSHLRPATFNIALDLRTHVRLRPWHPGRIKISSKGFETIERSRTDHNLENPMGLMVAVARYFNAHGVHIDINSTSPPRSALGGSSSAATAVIGAFYAAMGEHPSPEHIAWLAHYLESAVAGVPCGVQDQTAAVFGGVNLWEWTFGENGPKFIQHELCSDGGKRENLNDHFLVAYCGLPHESKDINGKWVQAFKHGAAVETFERIIRLTKDFSAAMADGQFRQAAVLMNKETHLRQRLTPEVLDNTGKQLFETAALVNCGARFTGAGGGGCLWAVGQKEDINALTENWQQILEGVPGAGILDTKVDPRGIVIHEP
ncbi:MAG: galactokinase [Desulfobacterales bacterium]|nr:MAG: galactokinase [Desulfobacterales bacterium]